MKSNKKLVIGLIALTAATGSRDSWAGANG
jgi:hypothetical protein